MSTADRTILGIDLGVTAVAMASLEEDGRTRVVPNAEGHDTTLTCVHVYEEDGVAVGSEARKMMALDPANVLEDVPWHLGEPDWHPTLHGRDWSAQELVALCLRKLREDASDLRGFDTRRAVLAVPAWWDSARRAAAVDAATIAGLEVLSLVNQPLAAALGAGIQRSGSDGVYVVFDLGGRDLEVTVLSKQGETLAVRASQARWDLCWRAFELRIRTLLVQRFRQLAGSTASEDETLAQQVVDAAAGVLQTLCSRDVAATRIAHAGVEARVRVDRGLFATQTGPIVDAALALIDSTLAEAGAKVEDVVSCLAVGRGVRLTNVQSALRQKFDDRLDLPMDPELCIARGAALLAAARHDPTHPGLRVPKVVEKAPAEDPFALQIHRRNAGPSTTAPAHRAVLGLADGGHDDPPPPPLGDAGFKIRDVTTQTLGLIALDRERQERVIPLIRAGTQIPCEVKGRFTYAYAGMTGVRVEVTEGRGTRREDVQVVGVVELRGLPPRPVGTPIEIMYRYDADGLLAVEVIDVDTGMRRNVDLNWRGGMTEAELRRAVQRTRGIELE